VSDATTSEIESAWTRIRSSLRSELGEASYQSWIAVLADPVIKDGTLSINAPNRFIRDKVADRFGARLREYWIEADVGAIELDLAVASEISAAVPAQRVKAAGGASRLTLSSAPMASEGYGATHVNLDSRLRFDTFVIGKSNELAYAAARRVAETEGPASAYNPLFLFGDVGVGKTHLMQSIAWESQQRAPHKKILYLSAEKFMHRFVSALRYKDAHSFKEEFRSVDLLIIDDFQFIAGKESTQEEFFHTFNALIDQNRQIVISADRSPSDLDGVQDRIKSRLNWGLVADIGAPDYELRLGVLQSKLELAHEANPGLDIDEDVLGFVAKRVSSNMRVIEGALNRLVAHASLFGRRVDCEIAEDLLHDLLRAYDRRLSVEEIQRAVADHFGIKLSDLLSPRRARAVARPRQIAMFLSKELTDKSLPEIGRKFGGRDHTTIMHGVKRVTQLSKDDPGVREDVEVLHRRLRH
jgi:chromosomal replication initiator protein